MIKIQHPNIVQIHYAFQNRQRLYLVVDFMSGGELYHQLKGVGRFSESQARFICAEISLALAYLHDEEDMAYRDLKPENVMFDAEGHIRLIDFGKLAPDRSFWKRSDTEALGSRRAGQVGCLDGAALDSLRHPAVHDAGGRQELQVAAQRAGRGEGGEGGGLVRARDAAVRADDRRGAVPGGRAACAAEQDHERAAQDQLLGADPTNHRLSLRLWPLVDSLASGLSGIWPLTLASARILTTREVLGRFG